MIAWDLRRHRRGSAVVEFALFVPVLTLIVAGTYDLGNLAYSRQRLSDALNRGANFALLQQANVSSAPSSTATSDQQNAGITLASEVLAYDIANIVRGSSSSAYQVDVTAEVNNGPVATASAADAGPPQVTDDTPTNADQCYCPTVSFDGDQKTFSFGDPVDCGNHCANYGNVTPLPNSSNTTTTLPPAGKFVRITASRAFKPLFTSYGLAPDGTISVSTEVQVQ